MHAGVARAQETSFGVAAKEPATKAAAKVLATIALVEAKLTATRYQHKTFVHLAKGIFYWDCSGMSAWVLGRAAPKAKKKLPGAHPMARQFHKVISKSPTDAPKGGWLRLERPDDIGPGDVFAWVKPDWWLDNPNTGHVGFVVDTPRPHEQSEGVWLMRVADASRYRHEDDSRPAGGEGGFGTGTMAFGFGANGAAVAYGWHGSAQSPATFIPTDIVFGRVQK